MKRLYSIDDVIDELDRIIQACIQRQDPLGYFAMLYKKVTVSVKKGIEEKFFEDNARMEKLDIIFAERYIVAYHDFQAGRKTSASWTYAFLLADKYWPTVLQHLLIGMNAHINLDLGIAAAEVAAGDKIDGLEEDFHRINELLSSLVDHVAEDLSQIWPPLKWMLKLAGNFDNLMLDFSMKLARNGAWKFAKSIAYLEGTALEQAIIERDLKVAKKAKIVSNPGWMINPILKLVRLGEQGNPSDKIYQLD
jgi:hypothetical protein